ncbi:hypothetical protein [Nannocystis radixulma]|uniref:Uncharacterized protein n=1 Tax=Nannocystis radixulma TaxID=2995305 RepID=A0ABT5BBH4_9BACT|nr:hypothetical protein [Nannocystis radixulma]MDC0671492.1 hypothetical protein [Nannocystis radixulma]
MVVESVDVTELVVVGVSVVGGDVGESVVGDGPAVSVVSLSLPPMDSVPAVVSSAQPFAAKVAAHTKPNTAPHLRKRAVWRMFTPDPCIAAVDAISPKVS